MVKAPDSFLVVAKELAYCITLEFASDCFKLRLCLLILLMIDFSFLTFIFNMLLTVSEGMPDNFAVILVTVAF